MSEVRYQMSAECADQAKSAPGRRRVAVCAAGACDSGAQCLGRRGGIGELFVDAREHRIDRESVGGQRPMASVDIPARARAALLRTAGPSPAGSRGSRARAAPITVTFSGSARIRSRSTGDAARSSSAISSDSGPSDPIFQPSLSRTTAKAVNAVERMTTRAPLCITVRSRSADTRTLASPPITRTAGIEIV